MNRLLIKDPEICEEMIRERKRLGRDRHDEVWNGVYVMPTAPHVVHQRMVGLFTATFILVVGEDGEVYPGINVSDEPEEWQNNFRIPDVAVVLKDGLAEYRGPYYYWGPDFLVEIESPDDDVMAKVPFYSKIQVRELLIVDRDSRRVRLLRHDGNALVEVAASSFQGGKWLVSQVLPLAFRRKVVKGEAKVEVVRTDGQTGRWMI